MHLREKSRNLGQKLLVKVNKMTNKSDILSKYIFCQLNSLGEIIAGISDGLLNNNPIIKVCTINNNNTQTKIVENNWKTRCNTNQYTLNKLN